MGCLDLQAGTAGRTYASWTTCSVLRSTRFSSRTRLLDDPTWSCHHLTRFPTNAAGLAASKKRQWVLSRCTTEPMRCPFRVTALGSRRSSERVMRATASEIRMSSHLAKTVKTPDHLDFCNVCFRERVAALRAASPQVRYEPILTNAASRLNWHNERLADISRKAIAQSGRSSRSLP